MNNLQEATERICELKGSLIALDALLPALLETLPPAVHADLVRSFEVHAEVAHTVLLHADISEHTLTAFEHDLSRTRALLAAAVAPAAGAADGGAEAVLRTTVRVRAWAGTHALAVASGFFFRRGERLFLVTDRHALAGQPGRPAPDRVELELRTGGGDPDGDPVSHATVPVSLYRGGERAWRQTADGAAAADVAALEIDAGGLPPSAVWEGFDASHLAAGGEHVAVGDELTVIGVPDPTADPAHPPTIARRASIASAYAGQMRRPGYFLTDLVADRACRGGPVLRRSTVARGAGTPAQWQLIGIHASRPDAAADAAPAAGLPGLHRAWYADILLALTAPAPPAVQ